MARPIDDPAAEAELAALARLGDREAFGELYDRLAPLLLGVALRFLREAPEASDLVHDVFLEAWLHVREYDPARASVRTWLLLRLRSRALDRLGRAEAIRTEPLGASGAAGRIASREPSVVDALAVRGALLSVPPDVRDALERTYVLGHSAREIAEELGVPVGTVKSRISRGLAALALVFGEGGGAVR